MRKYIHIFKTTLIDNLQYAFNLFIGFIGFFVIIFIFVNLWRYVYSDPNQLINGYNLNQMIWYAIITEIIYKLSSSKTLDSEIVGDIKNGNIAYNLNKPYNYVIYVMSKFYGKALVLGIISFVVAPLIGILFVGPLDGFKLISVPFFLISLILGITINALVFIIISLLSFWMEDSHPFGWVYKKLLIVIGIMFPVEFFPKFLQPVIKMSPVFVVMYGPAVLLMNFSFGLFVKIVIAQLIYLVVLMLIVNLVYRKGVKKLNVNGG